MRKREDVWELAFYLSLEFILEQIELEKFNIIKIVS